MRNKIVKALILAAGYSQRLNRGVPKQLLKINNKPLLAYTLDVFEKSEAINAIVLVVQPEYIVACRKLIRKYRLKKVEQLVIGGKTRQQSVFNALTAMKDCGYLVIHDGVRPLVAEENILNTIKAARRFAAATCAVGATDTVIQAEAGFIDSLLPREKLWHIQTPQAFKFNLILKAHRAARSKKIFNSSDDAQLLLRLKRKVKLVAGSYKNIKITTASDLRLCKAFLDCK